MTNEYRGGPIPFYGFCLLAAVMLFRSTVHFLKDDSGVNSIASIILFEGKPDPNNIVYMFSAIAGLHQLLFVMLYGLVLWRYRSLIPLMFAFKIVEQCLAPIILIMHPLTAEYYERTPPGKLGATPLLVFAIVMLFLAVRHSMKAKPSA